MKELKIDNGTVGRIILNFLRKSKWKTRTKGFLKALDESNIKSAGNRTTS